MPYLSASAVVIHYEEALYQVYAPLPYVLQSTEGSNNTIQMHHRHISKQLRFMSVTCQDNSAADNKQNIKWKRLATVTNVYVE